MEYDKDESHEMAIIQAKILKQAKDELDTELGKDSYPDSLLVSAHNWINKWMISDRIQRDRYNTSKYDKPKQNKQYDNDSPMTEGQRKAVFVITHKKEQGQWKPNKKAEHLPDNWEKTMTFEMASDFIDQYGNKKSGGKKEITEY